MYPISISGQKETPGQKKPPPDLFFFSETNQSRPKRNPSRRALDSWPDCPSGVEEAGAASGKGAEAKGCTRHVRAERGTGSGGGGSSGFFSYGLRATKVAPNPPFF